MAAQGSHEGGIKETRQPELIGREGRQLRTIGCYKGIRKAEAALATPLLRKPVFYHRSRKEPLHGWAFQECWKDKQVFLRLSEMRVTFHRYQCRQVIKQGAFDPSTQEADRTGLHGKFQVNQSFTARPSLKNKIEK